MAKQSEVTREVRIDSYDDMMESNSALMAEVYNDPKMAPAEKMKTFSIGVRNQVLLSRDMASRRSEILRHGIQPPGDMRTLTFNPFSPE